MSPSRLSYVDPANPETSAVKLTLKKTWRDGTNELVFTQEAFTEKVAELIPPTWFNLTRYYGLFAPGHAWRDFIVPGPQKKKRPRCDSDLPPLFSLAPTGSFGRKSSVFSRGCPTRHARPLSYGPRLQWHAWIHGRRCIDVLCRLQSVRDGRGGNSIRGNPKSQSGSSRFGKLRCKTKTNQKTFL